MVLFRLSLAVLAVVLMSACNGGSSSRDAGSGAEARPTLSADDLVEAEGDVTRELPVVLRLSAAAAGEVVVRVRSEDGSALAGEDYTAVDRDVVFPPGSLEQTVPVTVLGDDRHETDEQFFLVLSEPRGLVLARERIAITLTDDDSEPELPALDIADAAADEPASGEQTLTLVITRTPASGESAVTVTVHDLTANAGEDYVAEPARLLFADGEQEQAYSIRVLADALAEGDEQLLVRLSEADGASVARGEAVVTIRDHVPAALPEAGYGSGVLGALARFVALLNDALMSLLAGDYETAAGLGQQALTGLGGDLAGLFIGDQGLAGLFSGLAGQAGDPQAAFQSLLDGLGALVGLQDDPLSTLMAMKPQRAVEVVVMTGAQLPGWAVLPAAGVGHPYPSGANITGQADETEALAFLNVLRDPLRLGEVRDAHNGTFIYPLAGQQLPALAAVEDIAAWRWDGERFVEIPVQVDEKFPFFLANAGSTFSVYSGTDSELTYAWDTENWDARDNPDNPCLATYPAGKRDPVPGLDLDDEIVFMASDAGGTAPLGQMPPGAVAVQMVRLADALDPGTERVVYLTQQPGGSSFRGQQHYVSYQRQPGADQWIDRTFFRDDDPEKLGTSNTSYGANRKGIVCPDGTPASARESTDRFPRDGLVVTTDTYRWEATGRWMVRDIRIRAPGTDKPDWAQLKDSRPDLIDRWKGRAFQQSPDSTLSIVGFEDEQVNWEANATLLGERCGPVRCIRETWGADSGTNVTKTETFYRDAVSYRYRVRVHPIPPDGLYTNWDYNRSAMVPTPAEAAAGVRGGRYYTLLRPQGVPIDGINDDIGQIDAVPPVFGQCVTLEGPVPADANGRCPLFFDVADPTFNLPLAFSSWEQVSGKGDSGSLVYTFQLLGPTSLVNPVVVPYYRDDACFDDGTGDDPVQRPWPGEASTDARVVAGYRDLDGNGVVDCHERQGAHGAHGLHFLVMHDSDNAFTPLPTTEVDGQQWQIMVPTAQPTNVGDAYANIIRVPLLPIAVPLPVLSR